MDVAATELTLTALNRIILNAPITATSGSVTFASPSTLNADVNTGTIGTQNYNNTVTLANNVVLTGSQITMPDIIGAGFGLTIVNSSNSSISGVFSGGGSSLTKGGSGILTLSGANTYTGATTINGGTLRLGAAGVLPDNSNVSFANNLGVVLDLNNNSETIGALSGGGATGGNITLGSGTLTVTTNGGGPSYSGEISGTGGLVKEGFGLLSLSGTNTYTGTTTINAGELDLGTNAIPNSSAVILANVAGAQLFMVSDNTINSLSGGGTTGGNINLGPNTLTVNQGSYAGVISGTGGLTKISNNSLTLSGANTYTGATTMTGILNLDATGSLSDSTALTLANVAGTTFNTIFHNETIGSLAGGGALGGDVTLGATVLTAGGNNSSTTFGGLITSGSVASGLIKEGSGSLVLTGNNTFPGSITINGGTLELSGTNNATAANLNSGTLRLNGNNLLPSTVDVTIANSVATLFDLNNNNQTVRNFNGGTSGGSVNLGSGTLTVNSNTAIPYGGVISGTGGLTVGGLFVLTGNNTYSGTTTITGTLRANANNAFSPNSAVVLANVVGALLDASTFNNTIASLSGGGAIGGTVQLFQLTVGDGNSTTFSGFLNAPSVLSNLIKQGSGTLTLDGNASSFSGTMTINAGTLQLGASSILSTLTNMVLANTAGATLDLNNNSKTIRNLSGGGTLGGNITLGAGTLTIAQDTPQTYSGVISGAGGFTKGGPSMLTLAGANTYSGATTINAGTLRLGASNVIPDNSALTLANTGGAIFNLNGFSDTIGTLSGGGVSGGNISLGAGTLTVNQGSPQTYAGVISGSGGLTKAGSSILTLSRPSTYTGTTFISDGTLRMGASNVMPNTSALNLANTAGATFDLNGFIDTIGTLSGGGALGGNISLGTGGILTVNQGSDQTYAGVISSIVGGNLVKSGNSILELAGANTYGGSTTITAGTLRLGAPNVIPDNSALALSNTAGAAFDLNNFSETVGRLSGGGALGGNISLGSGTLTVNQNINQTYAGAISGSGGLTKAGANILTLSGANAYTGTTFISDGILRLGASNVMPDSSALNLANTAGVAFDLNGFSDIIGTLSGGGAAGGNISLGAGTLAVNQGSNQAYAGVISGAGNFVKAGNSILALTSANTYGGSTSINTGTLQLNVNNTLPSSSAVGIASGATLSLLNNVTNALSSVTGATGSIVELGSNSALTTTGDQTYGALSLLGSAALTSGGNMTLSNGISGSGMNLNLSGNNNTTFNITGNLALNNLTITGGAGVNTLTYQTASNNPTWGITGANSGTVSGVAEMTGTFGFSNIQNLVGGTANDTFNLNGGALSGALLGGAGSNILIGNNGNNTWILAGINSGSVNGIAGGFSNIQNLIGGSSGSNTFFLNNGTALSGIISGGNTTGSHTINTSGYPATKTTLIADGVGIIQNVLSNTLISSFNQINNLVGGGSLQGVSGKTNLFLVNKAGEGSVNDPVNFFGFNNFFAGSSGDIVIFAPSIFGMPTGAIDPFNSLITVTINGSPMLFSGFNEANFIGVDFGNLLSPSAQAIVDNAIVSNSTVSISTTDTNGNAITGNLLTRMAVGSDIDIITQQVQNMDMESSSERTVYPNCAGSAS